MDCIVYYYNSADKKPGDGIYEYIENNNTNRYNDLNKISYWRRILSNLHITPFVYEYKTYNSVEHAYQAKKFKNIDDEFSYQLCIESGSELSK